MLMLAVAVSTIGFSSCSNDDEGGVYAGAVSYSGPLVGAWSDSDPNSESDDGGWEEVMTFNEDGTLNFSCENEDGDWWKEEGVFYVTGDILVCTYRTYEDSESDKIDEEYTEFYYIISTETDKIDLSYLGFSEDGYDDSVSLEQALVMSPEDGELLTFYKM